MSNWSQTVDDLNVSIKNNGISLPHSGGTDSWSKVLITDEKGNVDNVVGNVWIFVWRKGSWYAGTWEYIRRGQKDRSKNNLNTPGVVGKLRTEKELTNFVGQRDDTYGFMLSGLIRNSDWRNEKERSNIYMATWQ